MKSPVYKQRPSILFIAAVFACVAFWLGADLSFYPTPRVGKIADAKSAKAAKGVTERLEPGAKWKCEDVRKCDADYLRFADLAAKHADNGVKAEFENLDHSLKILPSVYSDPISNQNLRLKIIEALNIEFLLKDIGKRPLIARVVAEVETKNHRMRRILLSDPFVGAFELLFLTPKSAGPHPVVVAAHGHGESADSFLTEFSLHQFPERGYALAVPTFRVMGADEHEDKLVRHLMQRGFTLMSIRVYEMLLVRKYLVSKQEVKKDRIGLLGHSGGSIIGNLAVRIDDGFGAYVCDCKGSYLGVYENRYLLDEFVPRLFRIHKQINDLTMTKTPAKKIPYAQDAKWDSVFEFFARFLMKP